MLQVDYYQGARRPRHNNDESLESSTMNVNVVHNGLTANFVPTTKTSSPSLRRNRQQEHQLNSPVAQPPHLHKAESAAQAYNANVPTDE